MDNKKNKNSLAVYSQLVKIVEPAIKRILSASTHKKYHHIIKYQISAGGKRLRPVLAILVCKMMGGREKDILYPAAALEILHNYTLIIDDIIDHGKLRRNKPTVWKKFGKSMAECIAIDYVASVFDIPNEQKNKNEITRILAKTLKSVTDGQFFDVLFEQSGREDENYVVKNRYSQISLKDYFEMVRKKTASLFMACAEIGGLAGGAPAGKIKLLKNFGLNLGIAFQIQDDILDIFGDEKKFGKKIGKDIMERKLGNLVILLAMAEFNLREKEKFLSILRKPRIKNSDVARGIALLKKTNAQVKAQKLAMNFIKKAKRALAELPPNKWNKILGELVDFLADRRA
jgi:geranylgeranyl diphosphate synthase type I